MFKISKIYESTKSENIQILFNGDSYTLQVNGVNQRENYENIFAYGENLFVLVSKGKSGVVQYDGDSNEIYSLPCEYDALDNYWHDLVFSKSDEAVYYNCNSKKWMKLKDAYIRGDGFLYGADEHAYLIIDIETGNVLWNQYKNSEHLLCEPCYVFCGRTNGNPEFYDICNQDYISNIDGKYVRYKKYNLAKPIIVNGQNIVGVCENGNKLGIIEVGKQKSVAPQWDDVTVELKVTLKNGEHTREELYHIANFKPDDIISPEEW